MDFQKKRCHFMGKRTISIQICSTQRVHCVRKSVAFRAGLRGLYRESVKNFRSMIRQLTNKIYVSSEYIGNTHQEATQTFFIINVGFLLKQNIIKINISFKHSIASHNTRCLFDAKLGKLLIFLIKNEK